MNDPKTFRDDLTGMNSVDANNEKGYRENIQKILDEKMSQTSRLIYGLICVVSIMVSFYFGSWVFKNNYGEAVADLIRLICGVGMVLSGILALFSGWSAITGKVKGRFYPSFIFSSGVIVLGYFWVTLFYLFFFLPVVIELSQEGSEWRPILGIQLMLLGFFAMVAFGFIFLFRSLSDLKFNNQKKLLEIEYRLCDLIEKIEEK